MKSIEKRIINIVLEKYGEDLTAILIFGSYNTGQFVLGKSDIDTIILFNEKNNMDFDNEKFEIGNKLKDINLTIHHFRTLKNYEEHIYEEGSWSSWITVICGSKLIYSSKEFENFRKKLINNPISKEKLKQYIENKDEFELDEYFKRKINNEKRTNWEITKWLFSHIRRKLQILNYYSGNKLEFDYDKCLNNLKDVDEEGKLKKLGKLYEKREALNENKIGNYVNIAKKLSEKLNKFLS